MRSFAALLSHTKLAYLNVKSRHGISPVYKQILST